MAIKNIIARGIGFSAGSTKWIPTAGYTPGGFVADPLEYTFTNFGSSKSKLVTPCVKVSGLQCISLVKSKLTSLEIDGMPLTREESTFDEGTTSSFTATMLDEAGSAIASASLDTLTLTLYDRRTGDIINSRDAQSVLNTNNGTVHATSGLVTWSMQTADNSIVGRNIKDGDLEDHVVLFRWTYNSSANAGLEEIPIRVRNVRKV